jgi:2,3-bisphosphoglycerate-independent phosphoglycerate mutase
MHPVELPLPSSDIKADSNLRAEKLLSLLPTFDCFYIHIKGPDEPGHDGDFERKAKIIADIDEFFFGKFLSEIDLEETLICVTADHSTPCKIKSHSDDPVPLLIAGAKVEADGVDKFCESECRKGSLGVLERGTELMPILMRLLGKTE